MFQKNSKITHNQDLRLHRLGAMSLFIMPLCYVCMFVIFVVMLDIPQAGTISDKVSYLSINQATVSIGYSVGYLVFGCLLLVSVQAIHNKLAEKPSHLLYSATIFGMIWVVLMMCSGMIALVGIKTMTSLHLQGQQSAETLFYVYTTITNALGGGIELIGGLWALLISIQGLRTQQFPRAISIFGCVVGLLGVFTLYQSVPEFKDAFGLSQIIWFIWMGFVMLPKNSNHETQIDHV